MKNRSHMNDIFTGRRVSSVLAAFAAVVIAGASCTKDPAQADPAGGAVSFSIFDEAPGSVETRSLLTASDIETKKTGITLAFYAGGSLVGAQHYTSSLTAMAYELEVGTTYDVYALVNMGDMSSRFPSSESGVSGIVYDIPSYTSGSTSVATLGMPMAGYLQLAVTASTSGTQHIPVRRLLAKVTATLNVQWGGTVTAAKVYNMNKRILPFGGSLTDGSSKAGSASDILSFQEIHGSSAGTGTTMTATFYVPENMQGTVSGVSNSSSKRPDGGNSTISGKQAVLTYLEASVAGTGLYSGTITYRSYLGSNATTNFDIKRNTRYNWTVNYYEDGTQVDDWKHDNDLTETRYRLVMDPAQASKAPGATQQFTVKRYADTYHAGALVSQGTTATSMSASDFTWSSTPTSVATVNSSGLATAVSAGTATISAALKSSVANYGHYANTTVSGILNVNSVVTYALVFKVPEGTTTSSRKRLEVGYSKTLQVELVTYADGVETGRTVLDNSSVTWSSGSTARATVSSAGVVTGVSTGDVNITAKYTPSGSSQLTATCYLTIVSGSGNWNDDWDGGGEVNLEDEDTIGGEGIIWD